MAEESAVLQGVKLTPQNAGLLGRVASNPSLLMQRFRQRVTALSYAIQTTPPPRSEHDRRALQALRLELFELFMSVNFIDLARDQLQIVMTTKSPKDFSDEAQTNLALQLNRLNDGIKQVQDQISDLNIERNLGPIERAQIAIQRQMPGLAIQELEEADRTGLSPAVVKPMLIDLYCDTGQPDKAAGLLSIGGAEDMAQGGEPGSSAERHARVYHLLGNYEDAAILWEKRAIPQVRFDRTSRALGQLQTFLRGEPKAAVISLLSIPQKIATQAAWEFDLALCRLESGMPDLAAEHFTKVLTLVPDHTNRPLIAYYLEKLSKPVPPSSAEKEKEEAKGKEKADEKVEGEKAIDSGKND